MTPRRPTRLTRWIIDRWVGGPHREFILGDLEESYPGRATRFGTVAANLTHLFLGIGSGMRPRLAQLGAGVTNDLRITLRQFRRHAGRYLGAALVLSIGLGVGTFTWGVRYGSVVRGLPVSHPRRMVALRLIDTETRLSRDFSFDDLQIIRNSRALDETALWNLRYAVVAEDGGAPINTTAVLASPSIFELLEFTPALGRLFVDGDEAGASPRVAVLSHQLWRTRFDADSAVVGTTLEIDRHPTTVVGVLPAGARLEGNNEIWLPIGWRGDLQARDYMLMGRIAPGESHGQVAAALAGISGQLRPVGENGGSPLEISVTPFARSFRGPNTSVFERVLYSSGALMFLMALANAANLFIVQVQHRRREFAVRQALGAGAARVMRQLVLESALTAIVAVAGGAWIVDRGLTRYQAAMDAYAGGHSAAWVHFALELPHLVVLAGGALAATVVVTILAGIPLLRGSTADSLRDSNRGTIRPTFRLGRTLVALEVAFGGALLLLASQMVRSAWNLYSNDWGFATENVLTGSIPLVGDRYRDPETRGQFWDNLLRDLENIPGVTSATLATQLPMIRYGGAWSAVGRLELAGWDTDDPDRLPAHYVDAVTPGFFTTFRTGPLAGRGVTEEDRRDTEPVVMINESFAARYFPGENPMGSRMRIWDDDGPGPWRTVVGIAPHLWMDTDVNEKPEGVYIPLAQAAPVESQVALRVAGDPGDYAGALRAAAMRNDPALPVDQVRTMRELIRYRTQLYRRDGPVFIWIGVAALVLAVAGLYAVVSYLASLRTREYGVRSALGARQKDLMVNSLIEEIPPLIAGAAVGIAIGLLLTRGFARLMFLVEPSSPGTALGSFCVLVGGALMASMVPVARVSRRVNLVDVLKPD